MGMSNENSFGRAYCNAEGRAGCTNYSDERAEVLEEEGERAGGQDI